MRIFKALILQEFITQISLRDPNNPEKYIGSDENWNKAENAIKEVAKEEGLNAITVLGEAAFMAQKWTLWSKMHWEVNGNLEPFRLIIICPSDLICNTLEAIMKSTGQ
jgi:hypothetical protein